MNSAVARLALVAAIALAACGDDDDDDTHGDGDADADGDGDGDGDAGWTIETVDPDDAANQTSLAVSPSGEVGIAYYVVSSYSDGDPCPAGGPSFRWALRFASGAPGAMNVEEVTSTLAVVGPHGVSLAYDGEVPRLVVVAGDIDPVAPQYCGAGDLHLFSRGDAGWSSEVVVATANQAPSDDCAAAQIADFGVVVGFDPALAIDAEGQQAVAWRDPHIGTVAQSKPWDLEAALRAPGGAWAYEMIACGSDAGAYTTLAWDAAGDLVAAWGNDGSVGGNEGVWLARRGGAEWETHRLREVAVTPRVSMALAPDGTIGAVWQQDRILQYASVAPGRPLSEAVLEPASPVTIAAGGHASLAFTADGTPVVSHYRCNQSGSDAGCSAVEDGPVWSWRDDGNWETDDIEPALDEWLCGDNTQIGVRPDGSIVVAYTCQIREGDGTFRYTLRLASRPRL